MHNPTIPLTQYKTINEGNTNTRRSKTVLHLLTQLKHSIYYTRALTNTRTQHSNTNIEQDHLQAQHSNT